MRENGIRGVGSWGICLLMGYKHVAPLGLNAPMNW